MTELQKRLFTLSDPKYKEFHSRLIPTVDKDRVIGVRTPALKALAKEIYGSPVTDVFLRELPHKYYEENNLHAFLIAEIKDMSVCVQEVERFLPFIDNWATCDGLRPKVFSKNKNEILRYIYKWLDSDHTYTVRFAVEMLMCHFLDGDFSPKYAKLVAKVDTKEYYLSMMVAWYFATALSKQYSTAIKYIEENRLDTVTHNRTIQKAVESYRIDGEKKAYLKTLRK